MPRDFMMTAHELRLRRRKRIRITVALALLLVLAAGIYFGARPASGAIKAWQARRHAQKVFAFIEQEKWNEARSSALAGFQLRPTEPEAVRAIARFLSRTRQPDALEFWARLAEIGTLQREDRRDEATVALMAGETSRAEVIIQGLTAADAAPADWLLAAQLALRKGGHEEARSVLAKVVADPAATAQERLQGTLLELAAAGGATSPGEAQEEANAAWARLQTLAKSPDPAGVDALLLLARRELSGGTTAAASAVSASTPSGSAPADSTTGAEEIAGASTQDSPLAPVELASMIESHPHAKAMHKLLALDLRAHADPSQAEALLARGVAEWKDSSPVDVAVLAEWLNAKREFERCLEAVPLETALKNRELFLRYVDALGALARWSEIKELLQGERFPLDPVVQLMYLARCNVQLGETTASQNNWQRALEATKGEVGKLITLAEYAEKNGASVIAEAAFTSVVRQMPKMRIGQQGRLRLAQASAETARIHAVLAEMLQLWPDDPALQNDEAYTRLLLRGGAGAVPSTEDEENVEPRTSNVERRTSEPAEAGNVQRSTACPERQPNGSNVQLPALSASRTGPTDWAEQPAVRNPQSAIPDSQSELSAELTAIEAIAVKLVERDPASLPHRTLLALARLRQNKSAEALQVYEGINVPAGVLTPSALAVHAAVLAANGNTADARTEAAQVPLDRLAPEERALLQTLKTEN